MPKRGHETNTRVTAISAPVPAEAAGPRTDQPAPYFRTMVILTFTPIFTTILGRRLSFRISHSPQVSRSGRFPAGFFFLTEKSEDWVNAAACFVSREYSRMLLK